MIALLDYGAGNVGSVLKAIEYLGYSAVRADSPECLAAAEMVIFPGQGHFGQMMKALEERRLLEPLCRHLRSGKPFLGICLGLQALYEASEEALGVAGLGILPGCVTRFTGIFKVPHLGWSQLEIRRSDGLLQGVADGSFVYYCHSYYGPMVPRAAAVTEYGQTFAAVVEEGNVAAVQFHPEKSGDVGLQVLRNFLAS
ncbi:MAG: imidazole glycerol phosphate synthase subunit HisH [Acidobacteriia bacterium]|nr:imidazole glycerol phosphate synthase subunit HisH [Terriglobia bacterium]